MKLSDKIWITRKARINTERRLNRLDCLSKILVTYYSSFLVICSVINLNYSSEFGKIGLVLASILVLVSSVFLYSQRYESRALWMRNHYLQLQELQTKTAKFEETGNLEELQKIETEYIYTLFPVENHSEYDFTRLLFYEKRKANNQLESYGPCKMRYISALTWRVTLNVILFILPLSSLIPFCF